MPIRVRNAAVWKSVNNMNVMAFTTAIPHKPMLLKPLINHIVDIVFIARYKQKEPEKPPQKPFVFSKETPKIFLANVVFIAFQSGENAISV
jgi:hypothetical protein